MLAIDQVSSTPPSASSYLPVDHQWTLAWSDEFNGNTIDTTKWNNYDVPRERGRWKSSNIKVVNGHAIFQIKPESGIFTTAGLDTNKKFETTFGYFEIRCKLALLPGTRPAFWITSASVNNVGNAGRDGTEIDVFEQPSRTGNVYMNLHWDGYGAYHQTTGTYVSNVDLKAWHIFGLEWTPDGYHFFLDGVQTWATTAGGVSQVPEFMKLAVEIPANEKDPTGAFNKLVTLGNDTFVVDYVRVYKIKQ